MPTFHSKEELIAYANALPVGRYSDGVSLNEWKRQARERKGKSGVIRMVWPVDLADRFRAVKEWFHDRYQDPELIREIMLRRLETRTVNAICPHCRTRITAWVVPDEKELENAAPHPEEKEQEQGE